jgi:hypothetical protein
MVRALLRPARTADDQTGQILRRRSAPRGQPWAPAVAMTAIAVAAGCGSTRAHPASTSSIPRLVLAEARPIGRGPRFRPPATGPVVGPCRRRLGARYGVHVEVFGSDRVVIVPAGIGSMPPRTLSAGRISGARCFGSLATIDPTGLVLVRPGSRLFVSDLFEAWGQPLAPRRLGAFSAAPGRAIAVFVNGRRWHGAPGRVPLVRHAEVVLEAGPHVPPHFSYTFPLGT